MSNGAILATGQGHVTCTLRLLAYSVLLLLSEVISASVVDATIILRIIKSDIIFN